MSDLFFNLNENNHGRWTWFHVVDKRVTVVCVCVRIVVQIRCLHSTTCFIDRFSSVVAFFSLSFIRANSKVCEANHSFLFLLLAINSARINFQQMYNDHITFFNKNLHKQSYIFQQMKKKKKYMKWSFKHQLKKWLRETDHSKISSSEKKTYHSCIYWLHGLDT